MTTFILALFLAQAACPDIDVWVAISDDLAAPVTCPPFRIVLASEARTWPEGEPCTAWIHVAGMTTRAEGRWHEKDGLTVCVPGGAR